MEELIKYILQDIDQFGAEYVIKKLYSINPDNLTYRTQLDYSKDEPNKITEFREIYLSIVKHLAKDIKIIESTVEPVDSNGETVEGNAEYHGITFFFHSYMYDGMVTYEMSAASCYIETVIKNYNERK